MDRRGVGSWWIVARWGVGGGFVLIVFHANESNRNEKPTNYEMTVRDYEMAPLSEQ